MPRLQQNSRLLRLPAEIMNNIIQEALNVDVIYMALSTDTQPTRRKYCFIGADGAAHPLLYLLDITSLCQQFRVPPVAHHAQYL